MPLFAGTDVRLSELITEERVELASRRELWKPWKLRLAVTRRRVPAAFMVKGLHGTCDTLWMHPEIWNRLQKDQPHLWNTPAARFSNS